MGGGGERKRKGEKRIPHVMIGRRSCKDVEEAYMVGGWS